MRRFVQGTLVVTLSLLIGLAFAEVAVRIFAPYSKDHVVPSGMFAIDTALGWRLEPGYVRRHHTRYFDVEYSINELGLRDRPRTVALPDSTRRLLLFGDSHIFGWGVPLGQRLGDVAEKQERGLEIWNMAVPGYGLDQEVLAYAKRRDQVPANGVVFFISKATLSRMRQGVLFRKPKPRFVLDQSGRAQLVSPGVGSSAVTDQMYRLLSPLYLPYFVEAQLFRLTDAERKERESMRDENPVDQATMDLAKAVLLRAREIAVGHGDDIFVIAAVPRETARELSDFSQSNGIGFIPTGWAVPPDDLVFGETDHHWIPRLHRELGRRFGPVLRSRVATRHRAATARRGGS